MKNKTFTFDFSVDAWIKNLKIEAESYDTALEKLFAMSLEDLASEGYVKDIDLSNIDHEVDDDDEDIDEVEEDDVDEDLFREEKKDFFDDTEDN